MIKITTFTRTLALATLAAPLLAFATDGGTFRNGSSLFGEPADAKLAARTVDVMRNTVVRVPYGETVKFVKGAEQFTWTFNGLDGRDVPLTKIAPHQFDGATVHVDRNPLTRN